MSERNELQLERIVFFSDAVFAIAITLLIIEIKVPQIPVEMPEQEVWHVLLELLPKVIGYLVSFLVIGAYWIGHHRIYSLIVRHDQGLLWRNLFFLMSIAFIPFPTALFSEYFYRATPLRLYAASLAVAGLLEFWQWRYVAKDHRLLAKETGSRAIKHISLRTLNVPLICLLAIALSFISYKLASFSLFLIPIVQRVLDRVYAKQDEAPESG